MLVAHLPAMAVAQTKEVTEGNVAVTEVIGFANLRHQVLNLIGSARNRIWVVSDYLTDGEIVSALFIAQYRKLDVKVLLGRKKANSYMSRLSYLEKQSIPVFFKPADFPSAFASQILVDTTMFKISGDLNFLDKNRTFRMQAGTKLELENFQTQFEKAINAGNKPISTPVPMVGRAKHSPSGAPLAPITQSANNVLYQGESNGSYNYDKSPRATRVPEGVNKRLPAETIYQKRQLNSQGGGNP